jgi:cyclase
MSKTTVSLASLGLLGGLAAAVLAQTSAAPQPVATGSSFEKVVKVVDGVWFAKHNHVPTYGSNVAWIEFADFVVVSDTAFPRGAERALASIKETTRGKPIRYAVVTHFHGDHSHGGGVFAREGAIIVGHENARRDYVAKTLPGFLKKVASDKAYAGLPAAAPQITFTDKLIIDDGRGRRAELHHFGTAHTTGDVFTWLPAEKVLFTGDACVNSNNNYLGDGDTASWIEALTRAQALGPAFVVPGHGKLGKGDVLVSQKHYFVELRAQVKALVAKGKTVEEAKALVDIPGWKQWTGEAKMRPEHIAHVYGELTRGSAKGAP